MSSIGSPCTFVAIGIDFGTTFSGVSWAFSEQPEKIWEISEWPSAYHNNQSEVQVPTQMTVDRWGYEITPDMNPVKWFKLLLLNKNDLDEDIRDAQPLKDARAWLAQNDLTAVNLIAEFLKQLWKHTYGHLKTKISIDSIPLRVAISIPAIWPHYAKNAMREAVRRAGILDKRVIGETTLDLIEEPEAAGLSIIFDRTGMPEIKEGESFIVCDAGGGTVDVISYTVISIRPFRVKECVPGQGKLCGAVRVDEAFEAHLTGKTNLRLQSISRSEYNTFVIDDWERGAKRNFSNAHDPQNFHLRPPMRAYRARDRWKGKDYFAISREEMATFFSKSMTGIRRLVSEQHKKVRAVTGKPPKHILLVGGLGSSPYIHGMLSKQFREPVLRPIHPWSAVARGAVIRLLNDRMSTQPEVLSPRQSRMLPRFPEVTARKSRYNYGIEIDIPTDRLSDYDKALDTSLPNPEGILVTNRMRWYLRRGDEVSKGSPVMFNYQEYANDEAPLTKCSFVIQTSPSSVPPKRFDSTVKDLCRVECDFDRPFSEWTPVGKRGQGWRRYDGAALGMEFNGELKWKARAGRNEGERDVQIEYLG